MTPEDTADRVLELVPRGFGAELIVASSTDALTRFANSSIHQNMGDETTSLSLTLVQDAQVSTSSGTAAPEALPNFVERAAEATKVAPPSPDWPGLTPPTEVPPPRSMPETTEMASPDDRAELVAAFVDSAPEMSSAGYCSTATARVVYANSAGHVAAGEAASAIIDGIQQTSTSAGSGHAASRDLGELDATAAGMLAADRARRSESHAQIEPDEYEVVLAPEAVATLALFLGVYGFNGKAVNEGQSFLRLGERQFDESFELIDDGLDERSMRLPFDREGTPKRRLPLVSGGVTQNIAYDRREAAKAGAESTGHAIRIYGQNLGPLPFDLYVTPGTSTPDELISDVKRGLYVSTFNYVRILDPRTTVATGLTRNGTFLIENGELTEAVSDMRFTQSFAGAVGPGRVLGVGDDSRFADSEFGPTIAHAPSMRLAGWRFTGGASG